MTKVVVDSREPEDWKKYFERKKDLDVTFKALKTGDYLTDTVVVERKEVGDLLSSIQNKRFHNQMERLSEFAYAKELVPILYIHGSYSRLVSLYTRMEIDLDPAILFSIPSSVNLRYGISVIWLGAAEKTSLYQLLKRSKEKIRVIKKYDSDYYWARLFRVSRGMLKDIQNAYKPYELYDAKPEDLMRIKGIGKVKANSIINLIRNWK